MAGSFLRSLAQNLISRDQKLFATSIMQMRKFMQNSALIQSEELLREFSLCANRIAKRGDKMADKKCLYDTYEEISGFLVNQHGGKKTLDFMTVRSLSLILNSFASFDFYSPLLLRSSFQHILRVQRRRPSSHTVSGISSGQDCSMLLHSISRFSPSFSEGMREEAICACYVICESLLELCLVDRLGSQDTVMILCAIQKFPTLLHDLQLKSPLFLLKLIDHFKVSIPSLKARHVANSTNALGKIYETLRIDCIEKCLLEISSFLGARNWIGEFNQEELAMFFTGISKVNKLFLVPNSEIAKTSIQIDKFLHCFTEKQIVSILVALGKLSAFDIPIAYKLLDRFFELLPSELSGGAPEKDFNLIIYSFALFLIREKDKIVMLRKYIDQKIDKFEKKEIEFLLASLSKLDFSLSATELSAISFTGVPENGALLYALTQIKNFRPEMVLRLLVCASESTKDFDESFCRQFLISLTHVMHVVPSSHISFRALKALYRMTKECFNKTSKNWEDCSTFHSEISDSLRYFGVFSCSEVASGAYSIDLVLKPFS